MDENTMVEDGELLSLTAIANSLWTLISKGLPSGKPPASDRVPTAEEFKRLIGDDLRLKVIVCIMSSCGIRVGAWEFLKVKHITPESEMQ